MSTGVLTDQEIDIITEIGLKLKNYESKEMVGLSKRDLYGACEGRYGTKSVNRILENLIEKDYVKMAKYAMGKSSQIRLTDKGIEAFEGLKNKPKQFSREHECAVASGLLALIRQGRFYVEGELNPKPENLEIALEHLKTGYPDIYDVLRNLHNLAVDARKDPENEDILKRAKDAQIMLNDKIQILIEKIKQRTEVLNPESRCELCGWKLSDDEKNEIKDLREMFYVERVH